MANNLTMTSAVYDTSTQKFGTGCLQSGYGSVASTATVGLANMTLEYWTKGTTAGTDQVAISLGNILWLGTHGSVASINFDVPGNSYHLNGTVNVYDGAWHHVAAVLTPSGMKLYVDGVLDGSDPHVYAGSGNDTSVAAIIIGAYTTGGAAPYPGRIDEAALWSFAKYTGNFTRPSVPYVGNEANLLMLYHLDSNGNDATTGVAESLTVTTPATQTAGATFTIAGSYAGTPVPTALDVQFDSAGWNAVGSPAIGGGSYSFTATAPGAGTHTVSVRDHNATSVTATSGSFTTSSGVAIAITTPGVVPAGASLTLSGTYAGTAPTGINCKFDSGSYAAITSPTIGGGTWSGTITAPAAGAHTVTVQEANATSVTATSGTFQVLTAPNNAGFVYSPFNWNVTGAAAITLNGGAYLRTAFSGTSCTLYFDVSKMVSVPSEILWRVDGDEGVWTKANVAASIALTIPASTTAWPLHLLELRLRATTEFQAGGASGQRWNPASSPNTALVFLGLQLDAAAVLSNPGRAPRNVLFLGDSITEAYKAINGTASLDTDQSNSLMGWAFAQGALLGAEVGIVGFGGQGYLGGGVGGVPNFPGSYGFTYSGQARDFSTIVPDLIVLLEGHNDAGGLSGTNVQTGATTVLNGLIAACPNVPIALLRPFDSTIGPQMAASLQAAAAACNAPAAVHYVNTAGFFTQANSSDGVHPYGAEAVGHIAPLVAAQLKPLLPSGATASYRGGFRRTG